MRDGKCPLSRLFDPVSIELVKMFHGEDFDRNQRLRFQCSGDQEAVHGVWLIERDILFSGVFSALNTET